MFFEIPYRMNAIAWPGLGIRESVHFSLRHTVIPHSYVYHLYACDCSALLVRINEMTDSDSTINHQHTGIHTHI